MEGKIDYYPAITIFPNPLSSVLYYNDLVIPKGIAEPLHFSPTTCDRLLREGFFLVLYKRVKGKIESKEQLFSKGLLMKVLGKNICIDDNQTFNLLIDQSTSAKTIFVQCVEEIEIVDFDSNTYLTKYIIPRLYVDESKKNSYRTQILEKMDRILEKFTKPKTSISDYNSLSSLEDLFNAVFVFLVLNECLNFDQIDGEHRLYLETNDLENRFQILSDALNNFNFSSELNSKNKSMELAVTNQAGSSFVPPSETETVIKKIEGIVSIPEEVKGELINKAKRSTGDSTSNKASTLEYLDVVTKIPWDFSANSDFEISKVRETFETMQYGMREAKERVIEYLVASRSNDNGPILCLIGAPGTGKTLFAKNIAKVLGRESTTISLGGIDDVTILRGQRRGWVGSEPGQLIKALINTKIMNPVIILDEIDKISGWRADQIRAALLEILDPNLNKEFKDAYLDIPVDLGKVFFVATANYFSGLPPALHNRLEIISIDPYTPEEKVEITSKFLIPKILRDYKINYEDIVFDQSAILAICDCFNTDAGMRRIEQTINKIVRKYSVEKMENKVSTLGSYVVDKENIEHYVKLRPFDLSSFDPKSQVIGEVNTLSVSVDSMGSVTGGGRGSLQIRTTPGKGKITITGSLMDIYKESITVALGFLRTNSNMFDIEPNFFTKNDIMIHAPETSVPKDGPSAGIALVIGILSAIKKLPISQSYGATGEVDLGGNVLAIGGLKQKITSCYHIGIKTFIIPEANRMDYDNDIPEDIKKNITIYFVRHVGEVIKIFFPDLEFQS